MHRRRPELQEFKLNSLAFSGNVTCPDRIHDGSMFGRRGPDSDQKIGPTCPRLTFKMDVEEAKLIAPFPEFPQRRFQRPLQFGSFRGIKSLITITPGRWSLGCGQPPKRTSTEGWTAVQSR